MSRWEGETFCGAGATSIYNDNDIAPPRRHDGARPASGPTDPGHLAVSDDEIEAINLEVQQIPWRMELY